MDESNNIQKKPKITILEEKDYSIGESPPPNFHNWFNCKEMWERLEKFNL